MYLCGGLPLIIDAFGCQSSMRCVAIISCSECALFGDGVTLRSGGSVDGMKNSKIVWKLCGYLFWPQRRPKEET